MLNKQYFFLCTSLLYSSSIFAQVDERWQFTLTPVLWNASVDATLANDESGGIDLPIDPDYRFFSLENLDDYVSLKFEANHGRYGILFDSLKARYQDEASTRLANFSVGTDLGFIELSARYQLTSTYELDLIAGVRRTFLDIDQSRQILMIPATTERYSFSWTDPLIGLRYHHALSDSWHAWLRGDIGGFNVSTQRVINISADVQYRLNSRFSFTMGYRYLEIDFKDDDVLYDVALNGLQIGFSIHF